MLTRRDAIVFACACPILASSKGGGRRIFFVSSTGQDANDGLSPKGAISSIAQLRKILLQAGDTVLFRKGDTFVGSLSGLSVSPKVAGSLPIYFGTYGSGAEPVITGRIKIPKNCIIYRPGVLEVDLLELSKSRILLNFSDKVEILNPAHISVGDGPEFGVNSISRAVEAAVDPEIILTGNKIQIRRNDLVANAEHLFVTPAEDGFRTAINFEIRNIRLSGFGGHGVRILGGVTHGLVSGCLIDHIGGSLLNGKIGYGNGVECWNETSNITVVNNVFRDIYDAAFTLQGGPTNKGLGWKNVKFSNNSVSRSQQGVELWAQCGSTGWGGPCILAGGMEKVAISNNMFFNIGEGLPQYLRPAGGNIAAILFYGIEGPKSDIIIQHNRFLLGRSALFYLNKGQSLLPNGVKFQRNDIVIDDGAPLIYGRLLNRKESDSTSLESVAYRNNTVRSR